MANRMQPVLRSFAMRAAQGDGLLAEADILASASPWQNLCGVYFLISAGRVRYVGQALQVCARLATHAREKQPFDSVAVVECDPIDLNVIESLYIHRLRPEWNGKCGDQMVAPMRERDLWKNRSTASA